MENIPAHIFDWIEQKTFEELSINQQQEVKKYLNSEEYNSLYKAALIANTYAKSNEEKLQPSSNALAELHTVFDATYPEKEKQLTPLLFWKVAASILLIAVGALSLGWYNAQHQKPQVITHIKTDTVYVNGAKQIPNEIKIYDTMYLEKSIPKKQNKNYPNTRPSNGVLPYEKLLPNVNQLGNVPFSQKDQPQNLPKNNSIKDDTLVQNFDFVQL
jgi:hypothetical protein